MAVFHPGRIGTATRAHLPAPPSPEDLQVEYHPQGLGSWGLSAVMPPSWLWKSFGSHAGFPLSQSILTRSQVDLQKTKVSLHVPPLSSAQKTSNTWGAPSQVTWKDKNNSPEVTSPRLCSNFRIAWIFPFFLKYSRIFCKDLTFSRHTARYLIERALDLQPLSFRLVNRSKTGGFQSFINTTNYE